MRRNREADKQAACDRFNSQFAVGTKVFVELDDGSVVEDTVEHPATLMGGHTPVAWLTNKGSFLLTRVCADMRSQQSTGASQ